MTRNESNPVDAPSHAISRTAVYVAAGRAIGAREPDPHARNPDALAEKLLGDPAQLDVDHPAVRALGLDYDDAMSDFEVASVVRMMIVRTRFIDDALSRAIAHGATQVVILGAGLDTRAYRCERLLAQATVFEVDRPETQAWKRQRANRVLGRPPANLTYVPVDFQSQALRDVLPRHGYDSAQRTFFLLEGVTMYLPEEAFRGTLRFVAAHAPGTGIVFDYVTGELIEMLGRIDMASVSPTIRPLMERFLTLTRDEPWRFGVPFGKEQEFFDAFGLEIRERLTIGGADSVQRYLTKADGTQVGAEALAEVMARVAAEAPPQQPVSAEQMHEQQRLMAHQLAHVRAR